MRRGNAQVGLRGADESGKLAGVLAANILEGHDGGGLLVDDCAKTGLALDDDVRDTHLTAESRQEDDELNRVNIVGDDYERRLLCLDEGNTVVQAVLGEEGLLRVFGLSLLLLSSRLSGSLKTSLLLLLAFRAVPVVRSAIDLQQMGL